MPTAAAGSELGVIDFVIAGLGNPGKEHESDRHNVGFWCVEQLARRCQSKLRKSGQAMVGDGVLKSANVCLVEPLTFMNRSGSAIAPLLRKDGIPTSKLIVVYDDLDLPSGKVRLRPNGGNGGHNGIRSIIDATGGQTDFGRVRIGIGRPREHGVPSWDPEVVRRYVMGAPQGEEKKMLDDAIERACDAIEAIIEIGWERAMNHHNRE